MIGVKKIGHATFETPDLERQIAYYTEVLGLTLTDREKDRAYLASTLDHHSVVLTRGDEARCSKLSFQVAPGTDLKDYARQLAGHDVSAELRSDPEPGIRSLLSFSDPKGTTIEAYAERDFAQQNYAERGVAPLKLGHLAFNVDDVQQIVNWYVKVLGFRESDWMGDFFAFLRCGPDHHTVNFVRGARVKMHHIAFELRDWSHIQSASDILGRSGHPLIWGPGRHGMGHNIYTYHRDPDGQIVELFTELDQINDEELGYFEPRPWHEDRPQRPKVWKPGVYAANLWGVAPPSDFLD
ncbi:glyoxalase [Rhizobium rhizogenes]|uniref:Glyoxalase/bleomycin resistance protein/dioxygenase protein n=1 Tax=Rhizobium rhizogenes (strain K84 / ATCC BAA-868) TaxID=311403 RepID=B9JMM0_RHIR8|nr:MULTISPECIES: VOC family protein [Rhizobium]ACM28801.1 Glyoxalase/bleomycin resistance protein/dioxygenase protein [Rhizobium rhizogenes K84]OCJ18938.1 glyoxalase [Agrobacterium sp. B131/95]EJK88097.1 putative ring-cleavage extradiol dioxygenase [Rhizobium sp. AP16]NTI24472.1 glyoxalase [Rhizobium rhizogenes]NTI43792.1 glyoxalase [Rhizobium rhizogenes]